MADIKLYVADMSSSREIKTRQQQAELILNGKKIPFEKIDISEDKDLRTRMRELCDNPTALPPQLFYRDYYLGDFDALVDANEDGALMTFLRLSDPPSAEQCARNTTNGNTATSSDQVDSSTNNVPVPSEPISPLPAACQQTYGFMPSPQYDVTNNGSDAAQRHNDVTNNAECYAEQKTFVSSTTFTLSSP